MCMFFTVIFILILVKQGFFFSPHLIFFYQDKKNDIH